MDGHGIGKLACDSELGFDSFEFIKVPREKGTRVVFVLDNASWHKPKRLNWHHIEAVYLPAYNLDFNLIERL